MVTDSFFTLACAGLIGILFGLALTFAGYRFFLILLPIWGFIFGMALGAQTVQALFGQAFLATVTSWVVGFIVGGIFAVLSYLFYMLAVAHHCRLPGLCAAVGILLAIGLPMGFLVWLIGIIAAVLLAIVTLRFDLAKWVIIIATSILGAGTIIGSIVLMFIPAALSAEPGQGAAEHLAACRDPVPRGGRAGHCGADQAESELHSVGVRPLGDSVA